MRKSSPLLLVITTGVLLSVLIVVTRPGASHPWPDLDAGQVRPAAAPDPQTHALMDQISAAFEAAASKVSGFIVPIFAEQVV
jgi:hypothetical protein